NPQRHLYWRLFDCMVDPDSGRYLSEDYAFCRRWRDIGGKVHVDLHCKLMHLGQHLFRGDLAESLRLQGRWGDGCARRIERLSTRQCRPRVSLRSTGATVQGREFGPTFPLHLRWSSQMHQPQVNIECPPSMLAHIREIFGGEYDVPYSRYAPVILD